MSAEIVSLPQMSPAAKAIVNKEIDARTRAERKWEIMKDAAKEAERKVLSSMISGGTGLAIGYIETKHPEHAEVVGVPLAGFIGVAAHIGGMFLNGEYAEHAHTLGNAGFAIAGYDIGADLAKKQANQAPATGGGNVLGPGGKPNP